eukprot:COSAG02_NODE_1596_length_11764_cov_55.866352_1_plen_249_part_00
MPEAARRRVKRVPALGPSIWQLQPPSFSSFWRASAAHASSSVTLLSARTGLEPVWSAHSHVGEKYAGVTFVVAPRPERQREARERERERERERARARARERERERETAGERERARETDRQTARWRGGEAARWRGGEVARWRGVLSPHHPQAMPHVPWSSASFPPFPTAHPRRPTALAAPFSHSLCVRGLYSTVSGVVCVQAVVVGGGGAAANLSSSSSYPVQRIPTVLAGESGPVTQSGVCRWSLRWI